MSKNTGRSCSIYFNKEQVGRLEYEAAENSVEFKEILKAKAIAKDGNVLVIHRFNLGSEVKESLFDIASFLLSIRNQLDVANDEMLTPDDITYLREISDKSLIMLDSALIDIRKQVVRPNAG